MLLATAAGCTESGGLRIEAAYSPLPPTVDIAAVYLVIHNPTQRSDTLIGVSAPGAQRAELHRQVTQDGMMFQMEPVDELPIPAQDAVALAPGGLHVMLFDLVRRPAVGDTLEMVFRFRRAGELPVSVLVRSRSDLER